VYIHSARKMIQDREDWQSLYGLCHKCRRQEEVYTVQVGNRQEEKYTGEQQTRRDILYTGEQQTRRDVS